MKKSKKKKKHLDTKYLSLEDQQYILDLIRYDKNEKLRVLGWSLLYRTYSYEWINVPWYIGYQPTNVAFDEYIRELAQRYYDYNKRTPPYNDQYYPELNWLFKLLRKYGIIWKKKDKSKNLISNSEKSGKYLMA